MRLTIFPFLRLSLFFTPSIRNIPFQLAAIRSYSKGKLSPNVIAKHNKEFKEILEFLRRPEIHAGDLKLTKNDHSGIALISINFPQKRNALSGVSFTHFIFSIFIYSGF